MADVEIIAVHAALSLHFCTKNCPLEPWTGQVTVADVREVSSLHTYPTHFPACCRGSGLSVNQVQNSHKCMYILYMYTNCMEELYASIHRPDLVVLPAVQQTRFWQTRP